MVYYWCPRWVAWSLGLFIIAFNTILGAILASENDYNTVMVDQHNTDTDYFYWYYTKPYIRMTPYIFGMYCG